MDRIKFILLSLSLGLSFLVHGQEIGNYVNNGSFEIALPSATLNPYESAKYWAALDSNYQGSHLLRTTLLGTVPYGFGGFQYPKSGDNFIVTTFWCDSMTCPGSTSRWYPRNRLKQTLKPNTAYCAKYYIVNTNNCPVGTSNFAILLGGAWLDTTKYCAIPLTYLTPQIEYQGNIITDTSKWVAITGTFVASGSEKYMVLGNFKSNAATQTMIINPTFLPSRVNDILIDDVSLIEINLSAYAGPDKSCIPGDSVFIGRQPDFAIDPGCIWFQLPNMTTAIDTISGLWVKPTTTSTYVVRQELDCSPLKWDTVVVFMDAVGLKDLQWYSDNINLFPNPTETDLTVTFGRQADINKISIINSLGQTIRAEDLQIQKAEFVVSTTDLDKGIYLIQFKTSAGIVTKQFVKN